MVEPLAFDTAARVDVLRHPRRLPALGLALVRAWWRLVPALRARRRRAGRPDVVVVGHLGHFDVALVRALTRPAPVVLDYLVSGAGTAADRGEGGSLKLRALRRLDAFALARADVVVVDTQEHAALLPAAVARAVVVPVGADARWFAAARDRAGAPQATADARPGPGGRPRRSVVFFGLFTPLQGARVVGAALRELGGAVDATVVGAGQESVEVDALLDGVPHVRRLAWVAPDDLPDLVAAHDVCLGIFGIGDKALRVVPNKAFQGAAAGCVVVTSDTPPQRRAFGPHAVLVPPGDPAALAAALRELVADPDRLERLRATSLAHARASFTGEAVVRELVDVLRTDVLSPHDPGRST